MNAPSGPPTWCSGSSTRPRRTGCGSSAHLLPTWDGIVYVAFVIGAFSRQITDWRASSAVTTALVLDALEHAVWTRTRDGVADLAGLVHRNDAVST
jgi:transposase InsO family protein